MGRTNKDHTHHNGGLGHARAPGPILGANTTHERASHQNGPHGAPVGRCERSTARRATHPRTASQAGDALVGQTSGFVDHHEKERYDKLILMTC